MKSELSVKEYPSKDNILSGENIVKKKKTKLIIGSDLKLAICAIIIIIIAVSLKKGGNKGQVRTKVNKVIDSDYNYTSIETVDLPEGIKYEGHAIYSKTGYIILLYKMENDTNISYIGVMNEDGSNLTKIWSGEWKNYYGNKANGIRLMPFDDNKKILTGDYVLECSPNIDDWQKSELPSSYLPP